jgi:hypothetical protein
MPSIYERFVMLARTPVQPDSLEIKDERSIFKVLSPVLGLAAELRKEGFLDSDADRRDNNKGVEFRWQLSDSHFLVICGLYPFMDAGSCQQARIVAGVCDGSSRFLEMPGCGWYPIPKTDEDALSTHWLILASVADIVGRYRIELSC